MVNQLIYPGAPVVSVFLRKELPALISPAVNSLSLIWKSCAVWIIWRAFGEQSSILPMTPNLKLEGVKGGGESISKSKMSQDERKKRELMTLVPQCSDTVTYLRRAGQHVPR